MPLNRLLQDGKIGLAEVERLNRAFTFTLKSLCLVDRNDPICGIVVRKVLEIDRAGIRDPQAIAKLAAQQFGASK
jgi:hypothetical protein